LANICEFLHPKSVTILATTNRKAQLQFGTTNVTRSNNNRMCTHNSTNVAHHNKFSSWTHCDYHVAEIATSNEIWKRLWYRDYGNTLLEWHVGRQVLDRSIREHKLQCRREENSHDDDDDNEKKPLRSLGPSSPSQSKTTTTLEQRLADHLDYLSQCGCCSMHDFYFIFGETYVNYLLARRNQLPTATSRSSVIDNDDDLQLHPDDQDPTCYMGLHGHIINFELFAQYHPGLIEIVLKECGQDATVAFENLPHSKGARAIAQRLIVMIHLGTCRQNPTADTSTSSDHPQHRDFTDLPWGLQLLVGKDRNMDDRSSSHDDNEDHRRQRLRGELRESNSRPLPTMASSKSFLPEQPFSRRRRLPTLARIRKEWDDALHEQLENLERINVSSSMSTSSTNSTSTSSWNKLSSGVTAAWKKKIWNWTGGAAHHTTTPLYTWTSWRVYYDPLKSTWVRWQTDETSV
jgi:Cytochrome b5-like Heme/Steroid binding domain